MTVTRWFVLTIAVLLMVTTRISVAADDQEHLIRRLVWETATRSPDPSLPPPVSQLTDLLDKRGINRESLKPILIEYAQGRNLPKEFGSEVAGFSMQVLVEWRCQEILPTLIQRATTNIDAKDEMAKNGRNGALAMVMHIGGKEALNVANSVLKDTQKYGTQERFYVYENLSKHLMTTNTAGADKSFFEDVEELLDSKIQKEMDPASVELMDKALATQSEKYRKSERRKNILKIHEHRDLPYQNKYFRETLSHLNTDHKVEIIENMSGPPLNEVSQDKALEIARGAIDKTKYANTLPIAITDKDGEYSITFPVDKTVPAGTRYRGPDYAAEVRIDKKTGKVVQVRLGE